jgi:hypothetical protein
MRTGKPPRDELPFASRSIWEHLARGVIGIGAFAGAVLWATSYPWLALLAVPVGLIALRGCPMCWTLGLVMTVVAKVQGRPAKASCPRRPGL